MKFLRDKELNLQVLGGGFAWIAKERMIRRVKFQLLSRQSPTDKNRTWRKNCMSWPN